jgi:hypothetical protein
MVFFNRIDFKLGGTNMKKTLLITALFASTLLFAQEEPQPQSGKVAFECKLLGNASSWSLKVESDFDKNEASLATSFIGGEEYVSRESECSTDPWVAKGELEITCLQATGSQSARLYKINITKDSAIYRDRMFDYIFISEDSQPKARASSEIKMKCTKL